MKVKLKDICTISKGSIGIQKAIPGIYPLVTLSEVRKTCSEYQFDCRAVIIPIISSTGHGHASMKRIHFQEGKFALGNILCALVPIDETIINAEFLYVFLNQYKDSLFVPLMKGAANVSLPLDRIANVEIEIPSLRNQLEILKLYNHIQNYKNKLNNSYTDQICLINSLRHAFMREAMQGKLVQQDANDEPASVLIERIKAEKQKLIADGKIKKEKPLPPIKPEEIPYEIPENWVWCRLGNIFTFNYGKGLAKPNYLANGIYPVYSSNGIVGYCNSFLTKKNALIIGRKGSAGAINKSLVPSWTTDVAYYAEEIDNINFEFQSYLFISLKLYKLGRGIKPGINRTEAYNLLISLPPLAEQQRIVSKLDALMGYCDELEQSVLQSKEQTDMLLQTVLREALAGN